MNFAAIKKLKFLNWTIYLIVLGCCSPILTILAFGPRQVDMHILCPGLCTSKSRSMLLESGVPSFHLNCPSALILSDTPNQNLVESVVKHIALTKKDETEKQSQVRLYEIRSWKGRYVTRCQYKMFTCATFSILPPLLKCLALNKILTSSQWGSNIHSG
jgi:hypothetical protein